MSEYTKNQEKAAYRLADVKEAARGRWPELLQALGISSDYLNPRKHTPCPACGGKDRFRFTDFKGAGGFICNHCTPQGGSGFDLLMLVYGHSFTEAVRAVAVTLGLDKGSAPKGRLKTPPKPAVPANDIEDEAKRRERLAAFWNACEPWQQSGVIADYLYRRGIPMPERLPATRDVRFHKRAAYWHGGRTIGHFPAMVCAFRDVSGRPQGLHITYFQTAKDGAISKAVLFDAKTRERLPAKKMRAAGAGVLSGTAIRLFTPENGVLAVCEGIETAFAARYATGAAAWACGSANGVSSLVLPSEIRRLLIIADNDAGGAGMRAARALMQRYQGKGVSVNIWQPDTVGADALDVLRLNAAVFGAKGA